MNKENNIYSVTSKRGDFTNQLNLIEDIFYDFMSNNGYIVSIYNDDESIRYLGHGGDATKDDKFAVIFALSEQFYPRNFSIFVKDRNGNSVIDGETVATYSIELKQEIANDELTNKFKVLLNDVYKKYKVYSKENRLDFVYNELEVERRDYTNITLEKDDNSNKYER